MAYRLSMEEGDALLHIQEDGRVTSVVDTEKSAESFTRGELIAIGILKLLQNEDWTERLVDKTEKHLETRERGCEAGRDRAH